MRDINFPTFLSYSRTWFVLSVIFFINLFVQLSFEAQRKSFSQLKNSEIQNNIFQAQLDQLQHSLEENEKLRQFKHDLKNQLLLLKGLIENNQNQQALKLLNDGA